MKSYSLWAALLVSFCLIACETKEDNEVPAPEPEPETPVDPPKPEDPPTPQPPEPEPEGPVAGTYTFVLPDSNFKPAWEAGDEISLRGNYAPDIMTITLAQENISGDGKTATVELTSLPKTFCAPDYLYAAYPASSVDFDSSFCDPTTRFVGFNEPIMVSYWTEGNAFQFKEACGEIVFTLDASGYDAVIFGGNAREDILFNYLKATFSSEQKISTKKPTDGHPYFTIPLSESGEYRIYVPSKTTFKQGFGIWLKKGDSYPLAYTYTESISFRTDVILELGNITSSMKEYDGPAPEEMKMPEIVAKKEYKVNVEELSGICLTEDGESLWAVGDQGQLAIVTIADDKVSIQNIKHFGNDLEAVTRDPVTNTLYIGTEPNSVYRCSDPFTSYTRIFKVAEASNYGNSGIEGIAWYKDNSLYVGTQVGANLWRYDLEGNILDFISLKDVRSNIREIGGLCYDPVLDWLWVTDSEDHSLFVFSGDARTYYGRYKLSSSYNNESVCVDHKHGCVWVGDDNDDQPLIIRLDMPGLNEIAPAE